MSRPYHDNSSTRQNHTRFVNTAAALSGELSNAEVLLWQGKFRRLFVLLLGLGTVTLEWSDVIANDSVLARRIGVDSAMLVCIGLIFAYLVLNEVILAIVKRRAQAGNRAVTATVVADMALLFSTMYAGTPAAGYTRVLLISIFTVQLTQLYFGSRATMYNLACVALLYVVLVLVAMKAGAPVSVSEEFWNLSLYLVGMLVLVAFQGQMSDRLRRITVAFNRAQEGDFSVQYDENPDEMPDAITAVGRAFNRMRGRLETIVLTDPLSGCYNRRGFDHLASREVARAMRIGHSLAVLAVDVDHFKKVNDDFGHLTGDEVIREMSALLRETARLGDIVARIGGEEFEILAPDTNAEGAQILADRIQNAFRSTNFESLGGNRKITVSIGFAADVARGERAVSALMARADEALYVAKTDGRDRTELWHAAMRGRDGSGPKRRAQKTADYSTV